MSKKRKLVLEMGQQMLFGQKRDSPVALCPTSWSLCPSSLGGGCCPADSSCGTSSCFPTTRTTAFDEGNMCSVGSTTCGVVYGGCCQSGYSCERNGCIAPTRSLGAACSPGYFPCAASLSFGCCPNGLSCGVSTCIETTSTTSVTITLTLTSTNSNSVPTTITTVLETVYNPITTAPASSSPLPTPVAKLPASTTAASTSKTSIISKASGVNTKELGGIIGGCILLFLAVLALIYFILRHMNLTISLTSISTSRPGGSKSRSSNNISIDSLQQTSFSPTSSHSFTDRISGNGPGNRSSNPRGSRMPPLGSFSLNWPSRIYKAGNASSSLTTSAYRSVPSSDGSRHWRNNSDGSQSISNPTTIATMNAQTAELGSSSHQGYFDIPIRRPASTMGSRHGHGRQWSDVSELSNGTEDTDERYELEAPSVRSPQGHKSGGHEGRNLMSDKKSLRQSLKSKVQDWVGMTSLARTTSRKKDEGFGFTVINGGLGGFKPLPSPPQASPSPAGSVDHHVSAMANTTRFAEKSNLTAIREARRESCATVDESGTVSESRAQIARMEPRRADSDSTVVMREGAWDSKGWDFL